MFRSGTHPTLRTFKRDCVAAGLGTKTRAAGTATGQERCDLADESGRALDFHCLRVTFVSNLVAAGVHPRVAQALARHANVETTMAVYADLTALDLRGAVERAGGAHADPARRGADGVAPANPPSTRAATFQARRSSRSPSKRFARGPMTAGSCGARRGARLSRRSGVPTGGRAREATSG
ncbi:MAG: tyrosine-type recombinase/integrase, partial [Planctomycetia bacterium]|nr:tyrosine-type recombinase/integrase [Planctomycetia bacterium]